MISAPLDVVIEQHRETGTHIDGPRCPMYPSCAAYARHAVRDHGFVGLLMFIDRLFYREFGDLSTRYLVVPRRKSTAPRFYDPVSDSLPPGEHRPSLFTEDFRERAGR